MAHYVHLASVGIMTTQTAIIIVVAAVALIAVIAARSGGPRVTHIETRHEKKDEGDDA